MNVSKTTFLVFRLMRIRFRGIFLFNMVTDIHTARVKRDFNKATVISSLILVVFGLNVVSPVFAIEPTGYFPVTGPCFLEFPEDHGAHPGYRTEWWYYTGNLRSETGDFYGFQLTFFRRQISPPGAAKAWPNPPSAWRTQQIYSAHAAVSDVAGKRHLQAELVSREALTMAGVLPIPPETVVYLKNWSARIGSEARCLM